MVAGGDEDDARRRRRRRTTEDGDAGGFEYDGDISTALEGAGAKNGVRRRLCVGFGQQAPSTLSGAEPRFDHLLVRRRRQRRVLGLQQGTREVRHAPATANEKRSSSLREGPRRPGRGASRGMRMRTESGVCLVDADGRNAFSPVRRALRAVPRPQWQNGSRRTTSGCRRSSRRSSARRPRRGTRRRTTTRGTTKFRVDFTSASWPPIRPRGSSH